MIRFRSMARCFVTFYGFWLTLTASVAAGVQIQNVAQNKDVRQSSGADADRVVDGRKNSKFHEGFCSLTEEQLDPWWRVDLGQSYNIRAVVVSSSDVAEYRLNGTEIWIGNSTDPDANSTSCGRISWFEPSRSMYCSCNGVEGQFVKLSLPGYRNLSLCEVRVYAADFEYPQPNVAVKGKAAQSSTLYPAGADRAIDGRRSTYYTESSCSHTEEETAPWWRVDLGRLFFVSMVKVTNRGDCCPERLDGAEIRIGNSLSNNGNNNPRCAKITHIPLGKTWTFVCEFGPMTGRYVNLVLPGDEKILTLCEVEVYADPAVWILDDVARNRPRKTEDTETTWRVNLDNVYRVSVVVVYIRDCCFDDIIGAKIKIGKSWTHGNNPVCGIISSADQEQAFYCSEMEGQYVSVNIPIPTNLTIPRIEVFGSKVETAQVAPQAPKYDFRSESAQIGGRTVSLVRGRLCWSDALFYCRRRHWDLFSVHSRDEQTQAERLIGNSSYSLSDHVWIGLRRDIKISLKVDPAPNCTIWTQQDFDKTEVMGLRWFWMSGEDVTFDKWKQYSTPLFPNPCGGMYREDGVWSPRPCEETNNFLCQTAPAQTSSKVDYYSSLVPQS